MTGGRPELKFFLDEGVPDSVGRKLEQNGHTVLYLRQEIPRGSPDQYVCQISEVNDAILVALDGDMRKLASRYGVGQRRYRKLSLIKLTCRETRAASRVAQSMSLIEHEWIWAQSSSDKRMFVELRNDIIRTMR